MAVPAATTQTYQVIGNREDLSDIIYMISPMETPVSSKLPRVKAQSTKHEWLTDALAAAAANRKIEGDDKTAGTATPRVRIDNYCQISDKVIQVSGTQRAMNTAGVEDELSYQTAKTGKELKRDIELAITQNQPSSAGGAGTARSSASMESWLATNRTNCGSADGSAGPSTAGWSTTGVVAPGDNSQTGSINETLLKSVLQAIYTQGGEPTMIVVGAGTKQKMSTFSGIATQYRENSGVKQATILSAAAVYVSDFGELRIVPDRFSRDRTALILDMEYWAIAELRPMRREALAKTGDSDKQMLITEWTLESRNQAASGKVTDINSAL